MDRCSGVESTAFSTQQRSIKEIRQNFAIYTDLPTLFINFSPIFMTLQPHFSFSFPVEMMIDLLFVLSLFLGSKNYFKLQF